MRTVRSDVPEQPHALGATVDDPGATGEMESAPPRRDLDEIIAVISHDLRGPLSALSVAIDALDDDEIDRPTRRRYAAAMRRAIGRAERFLGDLLDVGRIESGTLRVDLEPTSLMSLLEEAARRSEAAAHEAGNWFTIEAGHSALVIPGDRERLLQALGALIGNAIRFARGTGAITLRAEIIEGGLVRHWVIDRQKTAEDGKCDSHARRPPRRASSRRLARATPRADTPCSSSHSVRHPTCQPAPTPRPDGP